MKIRARLAAAALGLGIALGAAAQKYPDKPVRVINPFPSGGSGDTVARIVFEKVGASMGASFIIESRAGGGGVIGTEYVAKQAPDGYTLVWGTSSTMAVNPGIRKDLPYHPERDFTPVVMIVKAPWLLLVHPDVPAKDFKELVAWSKANPGRMNYGSYGPGTSNHLGFELLRSLSGLDATHVPYKGGNPMLAALLGGQVHATLDLPATVLSHVKSGKLRLLGVASARRFPVLPDAPTLAEQGTPMDSGSWFSISGPAGLPQPIVQTLNAEINKALALPEVRERLVQLGNEVVGGPPSVLAETIAREMPLWTKVMRERNLKLD
ncbi:MAG TPA: tripartite tricarboxylate transporter substrate binding protein [Burkholderiales bacterium]|nr:tripartite tricarboxylate transporter substrate binding protein [Burkholderiales bacterium]